RMASNTSLTAVESTLGRIVSLPGFDAVARTSRCDFDLAELSVPRRVRGHIAEAVLASEFLCDLIEDLLETVFVVRDECCSAGVVGEFPQSSQVPAAESSTPGSSE